MRYSGQGHVALVNQVRMAKAQLDGVRYSFEKVRWASAETPLEFNDWLRQHGHAELVIG